MRSLMGNAGHGESGDSSDDSNDDGFLKPKSCILFHNCTNVA